MLEERSVHKALDTYQVNRVQMASREELLLMTYDIGIRACAKATEGMLSDKMDISVVNDALLKAQDVVRELMVTLNVEAGGEMAANLMRLYDFMHTMLVEANVKKDVTSVTTVKQMMEELRETWASAAEQVRSTDEVSDRRSVGGTYTPTNPYAKPVAAAKPQGETKQPASGGVNIAF